VLVFRQRTLVGVKHSEPAFELRLWPVLVVMLAVVVAVVLALHGVRHVHVTSNPAQEHVHLSSPSRTKPSHLKKQTNK
jgi:hypothetical protein